MRKLRSKEVKRFAQVPWTTGSKTRTQTYDGIFVQTTVLCPSQMLTRQHGIFLSSWLRAEQPSLHLRTGPMLMCRGDPRGLWEGALRQEPLGLWPLDHTKLTQHHCFSTFSANPVRLWQITAPKSCFVQNLREPAIPHSPERRRGPGSRKAAAKEDSTSPCPPSAREGHYKGERGKEWEGGKQEGHEGFLSTFSGPGLFHSSLGLLVDPFYR